MIASQHCVKLITPFEKRKKKRDGVVVVLPPALAPPLPGRGRRGPRPRRRLLQAAGDGCAKCGGGGEKKQSVNRSSLECALTLYAVRDEKETQPLPLRCSFLSKENRGEKRSRREQKISLSLSHQLLPSIDATRNRLFGRPPLLRLPRSRRAGRTGAAGLRGSVFGWTRTRRACARESAQAGVREGRKEEMNRESGERLFFPSFPLGLSFSFSFSLSLSSSFLTPLLFFLFGENEFY